MEKKGKRFYNFLAATMSVGVLFLAGCQTDQTGIQEETDSSETTEQNPDTGERSYEGEVLNVVATSESYVELFDRFTEETGADVEFLSMSSGEVLSRSQAEGQAMADVWFGGGVDAFMEAKEEGLLEQYEAEGIEEVPEGFKDPDNYWLSKGITVVGFLANDDVLEELELEVPTTWEELADPQYEGEVIMSDPAVSGTNYAAVKGILDMMGEEEGWAYLEDLNDNIPFYGQRGRDPQEKTTSGEFAVGIIPVDKSSFDAAEDNNLTVVYPEDGIPWVPEGVAIFADAPNTELAQEFIDFMLEDEQIALLAELDGKDQAQMLKPEVDGGYDLGLPEEQLVDQDLSTFGTMREDILNRFGELTSGKTEE